VSDVALTCGFADQRHLTPVFTAIVGVGPGALRRVSVSAVDGTDKPAPRNLKPRLSFGLLTHQGSNEIADFKLALSL
jgi:AraC-like DNA-binding protein